MIARPSRSSITASSQRAVGSASHQASQIRDVEDFLRQREQRNLIDDAIEETKEIITTHWSVQLAELNGHSVSTSSQENLAKEFGNDRRKRLGKLPLVFKRGGKSFTHAARDQSRDLGENLWNDISIPEELFDDVCEVKQEKADPSR
ncbi:hypothetical protein FS837_003893, partial [Tulasnella sp. UAMH 9824]